MAEATLAIQVKVDANGAIQVLDATGKAIANVKTQAGGAGDQLGVLGRAWQSVKDNATAVNQALELVGKAFSAVQAAGSAAATVLEQFTAGSARADEMGDLAAKIGVNVTTLSEFETAAKASGASLEGLATGFKFLAKNAADAAAGNTDMEATFKALGVSVKDAAGNLRSTEEIFLDIADTFAGAEDGAAKTALSLKALGKSGAELIPTLNLGRDGLQGYREEALALGTVLDKDLVAASDRYQDSLVSLGTAWTGVQTQLAAGFIPVLANVSEHLLQAIKDLGIGDGRLKEFGETVGEFVGGKLEEVIGIIERFGETAKEIGFGEAIKQALEEASGFVGEQATALGRQIGTAIMAGISEVVLGAIPGILGEIRDQMNLDEIFAEAEADAADFEERFGAKLRAGKAVKSAIAAFAVPDDQVLAGFDKLEQKTQAAAAAAAEANTQYTATREVIGQAADGSYILADAITETGNAADKSKNKLKAPAEGAADAAKKAADTLKQLDAQLLAANNSADVYRAAITGIAAGQTTLAAATAKSAAAAAGYASETEKAAIEAKALQVAQAQMVASFVQATAALAEQNVQAVAQADAWEAAAAAGLGVEDATQAVANAALEAELAQAALNGATEEDIRLRREQAEVAADAARRIAEARQVSSGNDEIAKLQEQLEIHKQIRAGILSSEEGEKALAVAAAGTNEQLREQAARKFELRDAIEETQAGMVHLGDTIKDSIGQVFDALISGTLDLGESFKSLGLAIGKRFFDSMIDSKLKHFDPAVKSNFLELGSFGESVFGTVFDGVGRLFSGGGDFVGPLLQDGSQGTTGISGLLGGGGGGGILGLLANLAINSGGFFANSNPGASLGLSGLSLANSGLSLATGSGIIGTLFGSGASSSTLGSLLGETGSGVVGLLFGKTGSSLLGTSLGTVGSIGGGIVGGLGGAYAGWQLGQGGQSGGQIAASAASVIAGGAAVYASLTALVAASTAALNVIPVIGTVIYGIIVALAAIAGAVTDITPTEGTLRRRVGESVLDRTPTFDSLQDTFGDLTRKKNNLGANPALPAQREKIGTEGLQDITGFSAIFAEAVFGDDENGTFVAQMAFQWTNILTDFFSRMEGSSEEVSQAIRGNLLSAFKDLGISDASKAFEQLNDAAAHFIFPPGNFDYLEEQVDSAGLLGAAIRGVGSIFESELPAGVHIAALALESMKNEGNAAFSDLDTVGRETLLNLSKDSENFDAIVGKLFRDGFKIDTEEFKTRLGDITASAQFVGDNLGALFSGGSVVDGINAMGAKLKETILGAVNEAGLKDLFDTTNIAASYEPVFAVLRQLKAGDYEGGVGSDAFRSDIVAAIAEGKATLNDYLPQLRAIRDATMEVQEAIDEALKPTAVEQFWMNMADIFKANQDAVEGMAESLAGTVIDAERVREGGGQEVARNAVGQSVDLTIYDATKRGAAAAASESPAGQELARLTTEFQFKVAAAFADGVISGEEKTDLARLKAKMDDAGRVLADSVSKGSEQLGELFKADRLKEAIESAGTALKGALGQGAGSMFDVIKDGGSKAEGIKAFGEAFKSSVQENILAGMQEALVQSAILEGTLGPLMGSLKQAVSVALEDGMIDANEQLFIDTLTGEIGKQTDATIKALEPTLNSLGGIAEKVVGNTDKAKEDVKDLNENARQASYGVDEMARRAAKNLEDVADAVPPEVADGIKDGLNTLQVELGEDKTGAIADGMAALVDAVGTGGANGGSPEEISAGLQKLRDAFGPNVGADEMKATLEKLATAFGPNLADPIATGLGSLAGAFGEAGGTGGVVGAADALRGALGADGLLTAAEQFRAALTAEGGGGVAGAADEVAGTLRDRLGQASEDLASSLEGSFADGLFTAEEAARKLAGVLGSIAAPPGFASGGSMGPGGVAIVGERGMEMVFAHQGGGFTVVPMEDLPHGADGVTIGPDGGAPPGGHGPDLIGISPRNTGPFGRPKVPPPPAPPRQPAGPQDGVEIPVFLDIQGALDQLAASGDLEELSKNFDQATGKGIIDGIIRGLLESGPIKDALDDFNRQMNEATAKAIEDGVVTAREASDLADLAEQLGGPIEEKLAALGPAFDLIAERFGLRTQEETVKVGEGVKTILGSAIQQAFAQGATFEQFTQSLAQQTFNAMSTAIVNSFIQGALAEGALGVVMDQINTTIQGMADGTIKQAEGAAKLVGLAAEAAGILKSDELKSAFDAVNQIIDQIGDSLGVSRQTTQQIAREIPPAVATVDQAAEKACDGQCEVKKELQTTALGYATLDRLGQGANVSVEEFLKPGERSIFAPPGSTSQAQKMDPEVTALLKKLVDKTGGDVDALAKSLEQYAEGVRGQKLSIAVDGRQIAEVSFAEMEDQSRAGRTFYIRTGEV